MENENQEMYKSKTGFETAQVVRGATEIKPVFDIIKQETDGRSFICGGYVRYMCSPRVDPAPAGDVDIYSQTLDDFSKLLSRFKDREALEVKHENEVSVTFVRCKDVHNPLRFSPVIQLIKPINEGKLVAVGDMETILSNFDFTVIRCGLIDEKTAMVDADFQHDEELLLLRLKNIHCPVSSTLRCMKYSRKGYFLRPMQALSLFLDWDIRDEEYRIKLKDLVIKTEEGNLSQEEIDELEALMRID